MTAHLDGRVLRSAADLAEGLMAAASPVRFAVATEPDDLDAVFRLRAQVSVEEGWRRPEDLPGGRERDGYDDHALQVVGTVGRDVVACARIVLPVDGRPLPTEAAFAVDGGPFPDTVDVGRAIVARPYRDGTYVVLGGLAGAVWTAMTDHGYHVALMAGTERTLGLLVALGLDIAVIGPPRRHWGELRHPARFALPVRERPRAS